MQILDNLATVIGAPHVLTGADAAGYGQDWTGLYCSQPAAVLRPGSTAEVAQIMRACAETATPLVPVSGNTGLNGGAHADGAIMLSLERMNKIHEIRPEARLAIVDAGVVLSTLHEAAEAQDLVFPLTFGAKGSAMIGGVLSTNAGGSNVLRYGNTRDLCLGLEAVMADGRVMDLMSGLHKDNTGFDLKDLLIGAEGTLGIITAATLRLYPKPKAYATAMVALRALDDALSLLNRLQAETGGQVEAFEYMPNGYMQRYLAHFPKARAPFAQPHDVNIMVELGATSEAEAKIGPEGATRITARLQDVLAQMMEEGRVIDATVAQSEAQRREIWERREAAGEIIFAEGAPNVTSDVCLPLDRVAPFLDGSAAAVETLEPGAEIVVVAHLGDGNVHHTVYTRRNDPDHMEAIREAIEDVTIEMGGSFSAEHGIGLAKKGSMARRKNAVALDAMRAIKAALDPQGILNPGKVLPES